MMSRARILSNSPKKCHLREGRASGGGESSSERVEKKCPGLSSGKPIEFAHMGHSRISSMLPRSKQGNLEHIYLDAGDLLPAVWASREKRATRSTTEVAETASRWLRLKRGEKSRSS